MGRQAKTKKGRRSGVNNKAGDDVVIQKSRVTNNFIIFYKDRAFDSALSYDDAVSVANWLKRQIEIGNPPPKNPGDLWFWVSNCDVPCPEVNAETIRIHNGKLSVHTYFDLIAEANNNNTPVTLMGLA